MPTTTTPRDIDCPDSGAAAVWERKRSLEADRAAPPIIDRSKLCAVIALNTEIAELQADIRAAIDAKLDRALGQGQR